MKKCSYCNQKFNTGFTLESGPICIQCATIEGKMPKEGEKLLEDWNSKFKKYGPVKEPANKLASKLIKSMLLYILFPFLGLAALLIIRFLFSNIGLGIIIGYILVVILGLIFIGLLFKWLYELNNSLVAINNERVITHMILIFIIPLYIIFLTIIVYGNLSSLGETDVVYGRLNIV